MIYSCPFSDPHESLTLSSRYDHFSGAALKVMRRNLIKRFERIITTVAVLMWLYKYAKKKIFSDVSILEIQSSSPYGAFTARHIFYAFIFQYIFISRVWYWCSCQDEKVSLDISPEFTRWNIQFKTRLATCHSTVAQDFARVNVGCTYIQTVSCYLQSLSLPIHAIHFTTST